MSEFYNTEYLSERLASVCKERDYLKREAERLKSVCEKQMRMNRSAVATALELDRVKAERDALLDEIRGMCNLCKHFFDGCGDSVCSRCDWDKDWEWRGLEGK